jgi:hypothetical protein
LRIRSQAKPSSASPLPLTVRKTGEGEVLTPFRGFFRFRPETQTKGNSTAHFRHLSFLHIFRFCSFRAFVAAAARFVVLGRALVFQEFVDQACEV